MEECQLTKSLSSKEPKLLDKEYVSKIIQSFCNLQKVVIRNFIQNPLTTKGENYFAELYLLTVDFSLENNKETVQNISFVLKTRLKNELMTSLEENLDIFEREVQFYKVINIEIKNLLAEIMDATIFCPDAIYVDDRIIVMENLKLKDFSINDIKLGLNHNQCHLVLQKLGKFHALSMVLHKKNPDMFQYHLLGNISEHPSILHDVYRNAIKSTIEYCNGEKELQRYAKKLEKFGVNIIAKLIDVYSRNICDRYHVLNHGDMWVNNLMFKKPNDEEVLFIDFQEGFYGSPGIDWNYFIFTSWRPEVFQTHLDDLIVVYHESLTYFLGKLNYQQIIPTVDDVKTEIINKAFHGLATATCLLPILINEHSELAEAENFVLSTERASQNRRKVFYNSNFGERLKIFLKYFEDIKIL